VIKLRKTERITLMTKTAPAIAETTSSYRYEYSRTYTSYEDDSTYVNYDNTVCHSVSHSATCRIKFPNHTSCALPRHITITEFHRYSRTFSFTSREYETDFLMFYRSRYYGNRMGRFLRKDTFPPDYQRPLSINRFFYVEGKPVLYNDPFGYKPIDPNCDGEWWDSDYYDCSHGCVGCGTNYTFKWVADAWYFWGNFWGTNGVCQCTNQSGGSNQ